MFFRTRYGTKDSIWADSLALNHIETYTPIPMNMNCKIHEVDNKGMTHELATSLTEVPNYL